MNIETFNALDLTAQRNHLLHFCYCTQWADKVLASAPFATVSALQTTMQTAWQNVSETDLLQAFGAHPKIGDINILRDKFAVQAHKEQGQVTQATEQTLQQLMTFNDAYADKFGFIFIICASGKSAEFMLGELQTRLHNTREQELINAAQEQEKIMLLRLQQLFQA